MAWYDDFKKRKAEPEKLTQISDDVGALQKDVEAYIKSKGVKPVCKIKQPLSTPGVVLVLGNPHAAINMAGKPWAGMVSADILNDKIPGKPVLAKLQADFATKNPKQSKMKEPNAYTFEDAAMQDFFETCEARCNTDWASGNLLINAYVDKSKANGSNLIHEIFHAYEGGTEPCNNEDWGSNLDEGFTDYFAREFASLNPKWGKLYTGLKAYNGPVATITEIVASVGGGNGKIAKLWFERKDDELKKVQPTAKKVFEALMKEGYKGERKNIVAQKLIDDFAAAIKSSVK